MNAAVQGYRQAGQSPDQGERETLIKNYLPLVHRVARRLSRDLPASVDINDLVSAGCIGLLSAATRFDPGRGLDFGTFAKFRIRGAILDDLRALDPVPRRSRKKFRNLERIRRKLTDELGRPPYSDEIAAALGISLAEYHTWVGNMTPGFELSLSLLDLKSSSTQLACASLLDPDRILHKKELRKRLAAAIQALPDRQRTVVSLYYFSHLGYKEIALLLEVSDSRICQIHRQAVNFIRARLDHEDALGLEGER